MTESRSLLSRATSSLAWVLTSMAGARGIALVSNVILARLLSPEDFGVVAVPLLVITYLETVGDIGTGAALVQTREHRDEAALVTFGFNLVMGLLWWSSMTLLSEPIANALHHPEARDAMLILAWVMPIKCLGNTQEALLLHDLDFRSRMIPELGRAAVKAIASIVLALMGYGLFSLAWGQLIGEACWVLLSWSIVPWRPWHHLDRASLIQARTMVRPLLDFGSQVVLVNILAAVLHHVDDVIVAGALGVVVLGVYTQVSKLPDALVTTLTWAVGKVAFPAFARSSDVEERRHVYLMALRFISAAALPLAALLCAMPREIIVLVFGEQWVAGAVILPWLAAGAALRAVGSHAGDLFKGAGRADLLRNLALLKACITLPALALGALTRNAAAIAASLALATLLTSGINIAAACRLLTLKATDIARALGPALLASAAAALAALGLRPLTGALPLAADVALRGAAGLLGIVASLWCSSPDLRAGARIWLRARRARELAS